MGDLREIDAAEITRTVRELCMEINYTVPEDLVAAVARARKDEESALGRQILDLVLRNAKLAAEGEYPYCQDTGSTVVFIDVGQDVHIVGADLADAIDEGVRTGYTDAYLRKSIVDDPLFERKNTGDNTPAFVHTRIVPGDQIRIQVDAKGGGSENKGKHAMLKPSDGLEGVTRFVLQAVVDAGPDACPPGIIGVGIGGNFEYSAILAKRALMRKVGQPNPEPRIADLEADLFEKCNALGIGPQSLGGTQTVLAVHVEMMPTHIASLPVAVNIECHAHRTGTRVI
ncbi:MAG TPA: fumarate hydratase [Actinomycetota bacterium]|nr:fumarate hydratase [Actinomycetota bacterium]